MRINPGEKTKIDKMLKIYFRKIPLLVSRKHKNISLGKKTGVLDSMKDKSALRTEKKTEEGS